MIFVFISNDSVTVLYTACTMSYYHYKSFWNVVKHKTLNFEMSAQKVLCQVKFNVDQTLCLDTYTMSVGALL